VRQRYSDNGWLDMAGLETDAERALLYAAWIISALAPALHPTIFP
jgi:hypothetical protein